jgi:hypothetical protein
MEVGGGGGGLRGAREGLGWAEDRSQKRDLGHPAPGSRRLQIKCQQCMMVEYAKALTQ